MMRKSRIKFAVAGLLLSTVISLEATARLNKGTTAATMPVVVTILKAEKPSSNKKSKKTYKPEDV